MRETKVDWSRSLAGTTSKAEPPFLVDQEEKGGDWEWAPCIQLESAMLKVYCMVICEKDGACKAG